MLRAVLSSLIVLLCGPLIVPNYGQAALYFPPMELRPVPIDQSPIAFNLQHGRNLPTTTFQSQLPVSQAAGASTIGGKRLIPFTPHSEPINSVFQPPIEQKHKESNVNGVHDLMAELGITEHSVDPEHDSRTAESYESRHYSYPSYSNYEYTRPHEYSRPHGYWEPQYDHDEDSYSYEPPPPSYYPHHPYHTYAPPPPKPVIPKPVMPKPLLPILPKPAPLKPLLPSLPKPDLSSKLPLLLSIVQRLLGLPATGTGLTTLTTTLSTVLTPLLGSGSNIKSVLGKLLVPIIVLVLVNVEVLALTWWLWEDCSKAAPAPAAAPASKPAPHPDYFYYRTALNSLPPPAFY